MDLQIFFIFSVSDINYFQVLCIMVTITALMKHIS